MKQDRNMKRKINDYNIVREEKSNIEISTHNYNPHNE